MRNGNASAMLRVMVMGLMSAVSAVHAASDNFDAYTAGSSLINQGNGQVSYLDGAPTGTPLGASDTFTTEADGTAPSSPNVARFFDLDGGGSVTAQLDPSQAVDLGAAGSRATISFYFKTTSGPGGHVSMSWLPLYSTNAAGAGQDYINTNHLAGISDNGLWWVRGGSVTAGGVLYQPNTWYLAKLSTTQKGGYYDYTLEFVDLGTNTSLGVIGYGDPVNTTDAGRTFLTGLGLSISSNPNETILFDSLSIADSTPPPPPGVVIADDDFDSYGGGSILGQTNGAFEWMDGTSFSFPVGPAGGHVIVNAVDVQSPPNSMEFLDDFASGFTGGLALPGKAIFLDAGEQAKLEFDFKTTSGTAGRTSNSFRVLYSGSASGLSEDWIGADHIFGLADNGNWFLGGGNVVAPNPYQANTWYHLALTISRDATTRQYAHQMTITDIGSGIPLASISNSGLAHANRGFITGLALAGSSVPDEIILIDNMVLKDLSPAPGPGMVVASDDIDSYGGAGTSLLGLNNGQFTWFNGAPSALPISSGHLQVNTTDVQSAPNSMGFLSNSNGSGGAFTGQLDAAHAVEVRPDQSVRFRVDFKTIGSPVSLAIRLLYSVDQNGLAQDWIDTQHVLGIADNGLWFLNNGNTLSRDWGAPNYAADTWYRLDLVIERPLLGTHNYKLVITEIATGAVLGELTRTGMTDAGRPWLTGVALYGSSNPSENTLFDNFAVEAIAGGEAGGDCNDPFADLDDDGFVNNDDFAIVVGCFSGPAVPFTGDEQECGCLDRDEDGDIDLDDFAAFQRCVSGSDPASVTCDD